MKRKVRERKDELAEKRKEADEKIAAENRRQLEFENEMGECRGRLEIVKNKIKEITNQNKVLSERIELRNEEVQKKSNLKETLDTEVDALNQENEYFEKKKKLLNVALKMYRPSGSRRGKNYKPKHRSGSISKHNFSLSNTSSINSYEGTPLIKSGRSSRRPSGVSNSMSQKAKEEAITTPGG